jgi:ABC-type transport system involved in cytochrome c biogenesis ATPase subunit
MSNLTLRAGSRTALIGPTGSGKTTLLRTITGQLAPLAGRVRLGSQVHLGYMAQEQENLNPALNPLSSLQTITGWAETEARAFLSLYLFKGDDVFTPVSKLSFGERSRLTLAGLVAQGCNLLILDEPINHLDIPARTRFEQALAGFQGTILAVSTTKLLDASPRWCGGQPAAQRRPSAPDKRSVQNSATKPALCVHKAHPEGSGSRVQRLMEFFEGAHLHEQEDFRPEDAGWHWPAAVISTWICRGPYTHRFDHASGMSFHRK